MTATISLAAIVVLLLAFLDHTLTMHRNQITDAITDARAERQAFLELLAQQNREATQERQALGEERRQLADRIQHPEQVIVQPAQHYTPPEPPVDAQEMAMVGQIVPEFIHVGTPEPE